jgi:hypothetical protein
MYSLTNSVINSSRHDIWCAYSVGDKDGDGWDDWRVRLLRSKSESRYVVDLDYIKPKNDNVYIKGRFGWWKLGQGKSYELYNSENSPFEIIVICRGGYIPFVPDLRYYQDWARNKGLNQEQIAAQIQEWDSLKDFASPIAAE